MRIHLLLSKNSKRVPFNYQSFLTGALHKWLGKDNKEHGELSLYSFSWLNKAQIQKDGFDFPNGTSWFISSYDDSFIKKLIESIQVDPSICFGLTVKEIIIQENPVFKNNEIFKTASPVFIKRNTPDGIKFYYHNDPQSSAWMTETLKHKLEKAGLEKNNVEVSFDQSYTKATVKVSDYNGIKNKANICPVIIKGTPEQLAFAWNVGIGNSTGIGFGALH